MSAAVVTVTLSALVVLTACSFEGFRRLAIAKDFVVAHPGPSVARTDPVPYLGGLALFAVLLPSLVVEANSDPGMPGQSPTTRWIFTTCMLAVGLFDDLCPLKVVPKLVAQSAVCSLYLIAEAPALTQPLSFGLELALMLIVVNAFNLVDVMDGLLIVVAAVATVGLLGGPFLTAPSNRIECWALLAALTVAFLFNRPPARIYLGDAGALALGFFLSSLYLTGTVNATPVAGLAHLSALVIPLFELALLVTARLHRGLSPFRGSPDHFALRLQHQAGWKTGQVLGATAAAGLVFDVLCFVPAGQLLGPMGVALAAASALLLAAAFLCCWRLAPQSPGAARTPLV